MSDLDTIGRLLFGSAGRIRVAAWVYRQELPFILQEAQRGADASNASAHLTRLISLGMVEELDTSPTDRARYFRKRASRLWGAVLAAIETAEAGVLP